MDNIPLIVYATMIYWIGMVTGILLPLFTGDAKLTDGSKIVLCMIIISMIALVIFTYYKYVRS